MTQDKVLPFKGIQYNSEKVDSLADVVTPPYDVISPEMQDDFYARSPYNFCRVDYTKESGDARYQIAGKVFQEWSQEGVFTQDAAPAIYIHHHTFILPDGRKVTRKGFFAARRIEDFSEGGIKPHEKTLDGPKADRLNMTRATECNLSPVFSLYSDAEKQIESRINRLLQTTPAIDFVSKENERHQVWKLKDKEACAFINQFLHDRPLFIADGHHRYETALNYRNEIRSKHPDLPANAAVNFLLMYFSNMSDEGLVILPIHRALHSIKNFSVDSLLDKLKSHFEIETVNAQDVDGNLQKLAQKGKTHHVFWIISKDETVAHLVSLSRDKWLQTDLAKSLPESLAKLDVSVLHKLVFETLLGISEAAQASQENLIYWKSTEKAIAETRDGACDASFILNATRIQDMESVAMAGHKMPQKSTYFYPKIISGLLMHSVKVGDADGF